eukprot:scaffold61796_cov13-Tisochrysis_lutea.AAC.1
MTTVLCVNAGSKGTDWNLQPPPVCRGGCRDKTGLKWYPERAKGHAEILANKKEIQEQFKQAIDKEEGRLYKTASLSMLVCSQTVPCYC